MGTIQSSRGKLSSGTTSSAVSPTTSGATSYKPTSNISGVVGGTGLPNVMTKPGTIASGVLSNTSGLIGAGKVPISTGSSGITADDTRPSVSELYDVFRSQLSSPTIEAQSTSGSVASALDALPGVSGLGQDYFNRERDTLKDALRQEFFGPLGVLSQAAGGESAAGRLGSGVGSRVLEGTVTQPFAQGLTDIDFGILQAQAEDASRTEELNSQLNQFKASTLATAFATDSANALTAQQANASMASQLDQIATQLALGEAGLLSQEELAETQLQLQALQAAESQKNELMTMASTFTTLGLTASDWAPEYFASLAAEGMSLEEAKSIVEGLGDSFPENEEAFDNAVKNAFGLDISATL